MVKERETGPACAPGAGLGSAGNQRNKNKTRWRRVAALWGEASPTGDSLANRISLPPPGAAQGGGGAGLTIWNTERMGKMTPIKKKYLF